MLDEKYQSLFLTKKDGEWVDFEEMVYLDPEDIPQERIPILKGLLKPLDKTASIKEMELALSAARLLASWGEEAGLEYLDKVVDDQETWGGYASHRLRGYDITCELVLDTLLSYWSQCATQDGEYGNMARVRIAPIVKKIIKLSNENPFEIQRLYSWLEDEKWPEYTDDIKEHLEAMLLDLEKHHWKIEDALNYLDKVDPKYTKAIRTKYDLN